MKKILLISALVFSWQSSAGAADLLEVYAQSEHSDPVFQQAISTQLATKEGVPISAANLLPNVSFNASPSITRSGFSGNYYDELGGFGVIFPRNNTARAYQLSLNVTQTVFNFSQYAAVAGQISLSKEADATLNASLQNLMIRVANAYFTILKDEDNLKYSIASKTAFGAQLDQIKQQYKVGLKTLTDVDTAEASYQTAVANQIAAETTLANDKENLRVIAGIYYPHLASLSEHFPLISPAPVDVDIWVHTALKQNWSIRASQYNVDSALQTIKQQFGGHLPNVNVQGTLNRLYANNHNGYPSLNYREGPGTQTDKEIMFNLNVPIFSGGGVVAATNQAVDNYQTAQAQLEQTIRGTLNTTRQSYLSLILGISQIKADQEGIKSSISSLKGMQASYKVGTETLVDVLNQQQNVYLAQTRYANDRYAFVTNILLLKQAAGTLSFNDLKALNAWLKT